MFKGDVTCVTLYLQSEMSDSHWYHSNLYLSKYGEDVVVFLSAENWPNFVLYILCLCCKNPQVTLLNYLRIMQSHEGTVSVISSDLLFHGTLKTRGGRPATTISRSSHILLIFLSEPSQNPRPFNIIFFKCLILPDKTVFKE